MTTLILAVQHNRDGEHIGAIGFENGKLLTSVPEDMNFFKETTSKIPGTPVTMGRKTYQSIQPKYRPFSGRTTIVLTSDKTATFEDGVIVCHSISDALSRAKNFGGNEIFVAGGAQIYDQCFEMGLVDKVYLTRFFTDIGPEEGNPLVLLKNYYRINPESPDGFTIVNREDIQKSTKGTLYQFLTLMKK
ncbi:MAG: dihydrofolate reductase [Candidatus Nomurabacteria bacterium]|nr:dihydrofolate reductase [Candidatus Nomurabacteria bacterium]